MKTCGPDCVPCCDFCKYVIEDIREINGKKTACGPIGCSLHKDEEHQFCAQMCSYCEDFYCFNLADED